MTEEPGRLIIFGIISLFVIAIIYIAAITMIGGYVKPIIHNMYNLTEGGMTYEQYTGIENNLWRGLKWAFYLMFAIIIFFIGFKLLYQKEETSIYGYGGG